VACMLWGMKDFKRHAAQLLEYLAFSRDVLFRSVTWMAGEWAKAGMIFNYGCASAKRRREERTSEIRD